MYLQAGVRHRRISARDHGSAESGLTAHRLLRRGEAYLRGLGRHRLERPAWPLDHGEAPAHRPGQLPIRCRSEAGRKDAHWAEPKLVCEVEFSTWTRDGRVRHPSFKGMREDKAAREVRREAP